jgi:hypothetical protein
LLLLSTHYLVSQCLRCRTITFCLRLCLPRRSFRRSFRRSSRAALS